MSVGDVRSAERGSGARFNDGKVDLTLLPPPCWDLLGTEHFLGLAEFGYEDELQQVIAFWEGDDEAILDLMDQIDPEDLIEAARVFEYGAKKYAAWNWAKGMAWSVPMACYLRHMLLADPRGQDDESGLTHRGHAVCNLIMLAHFSKLCRDMDDRPEELTAQFHQQKDGSWQELMDAAEPMEEPVIIDEAINRHYANMLRTLADSPCDPAEDGSYAFEVSYFEESGRLVCLPLGDLPTRVLNDLAEQAVEEQESRERILRATGVLT